MSHHVPEDLLTAFVEGDLDDQLAVHIATHLDVCPRCATRAAHLEPLAAAFAAVEDPMVPDDLTGLILAAVERPPPRLTMEIAVGGALLVAATLLVFIGSDPVALAFASLDTLAAMPRLGTLATQVSMSVVGLGLAMTLFVVGSGVAVRFARRTT